MNRKISNLKNYAVARLLLRKLWQLQDASGVSTGRAKRNVMLEGAIYIMPLLRFRNQDQFSRDELVNEAQRRVPDPLFFGHPAGGRKVPHLFVAIVLLYHMREWYRADKEKDPRQALTLEMAILEAAIRLLPKPSSEQVLGQQIEDLIRDANDRRRRILSRRYR